MERILEQVILSKDRYDMLMETKKAYDLLKKNLEKTGSVISIGYYLELITKDEAFKRINKATSLLIEEKNNLKREVDNLKMEVENFNKLPLIKRIFKIKINESTI